MPNIIFPGTEWHQIAAQEQGEEAQMVRAAEILYNMVKNVLDGGEIEQSNTFLTEVAHNYVIEAEKLFTKWYK